MQRYRNLFLLSGVLAAGLVVRMLAAQQLDGLVVDPLGKATVPVAVASPATDVVLVSTQEPASEPQPASATTVATLPAIMENAAETAPASDPFSNGPTPAAGTLPATAPRDWLTTQPNPAAGADGAPPPGASSPSRASLPPGFDPPSGSNPFGQYPPKPAAAYPSKSFPVESNDRAVESIPRSRSSSVATPPQTFIPDAVKATSPRRNGVNSKANNDPFDARAQGAAAPNLPTFNRSEDLFRTTTAPDTTAPDTRQLANNWLEAERALLTVRLQADQENDEAALRELRTAVEAAFDARQKWQQAEVERLISDLKVLQSEIALRASQRERLIQKRMEQLAESKPGADPTAIKLPGRTSALPPSYPGVPALGEADRYAPESLLIDAAKVKSRNERKVMRVAIETRIKITKVTLEQKKDELDRLSKLHDQGAVPENEVAAVKADVQRNELLLDAYYQVLELLNDSEKEENAPKDERQQQAQERAAVDKQDAALNSAELPTPVATTPANPVATTTPAAKKPVVAADPNAIPAKCFDRELFLITRYGGYERFREELKKKVLERQESTFASARKFDDELKLLESTYGSDHPLVAAKTAEQERTYATATVYMRLKNRLAEYESGLSLYNWPGVEGNSHPANTVVYTRNGYSSPVIGHWRSAIEFATTSLPFSLLLELWTARSADDLEAVKKRFEELKKASIVKLEAVLDRRRREGYETTRTSDNFGNDIAFVSEDIQNGEQRAIAYDLYNDYFMNATLESIEEPTPSLEAMLARCDKARTVIEQLYPLPANQNAEPAAPAAAVDATTGNPLGTTTPAPAAAGTAPSDPAAAPAASSGTGSLTPGTPNAAPNAVTPPAATVPVTDAPAEGAPAAVEETPSAPAANNPAVPAATAPAAANPSSVAEIASTTDASTSASNPAAAISPATFTANPAAADGVATTGSAAPASTIPASTSGPLAPPENCFDLGIYQIVREGTIDKFAGELMDVIAARRDACLVKVWSAERTYERLKDEFPHWGKEDDSKRKNEAIKNLESALANLAVYNRLEKRVAEYVEAYRSFDAFFYDNGRTEDLRRLQLAAASLPMPLLVELWTARSEGDILAVQKRFNEMRRVHEPIYRAQIVAVKAAWENRRDGKTDFEEYARIEADWIVTRSTFLALEMCDEYFNSATIRTIEQPMPSIPELFGRGEIARGVIAKLPLKGEELKDLSKGMPRAAGSVGVKKSIVARQYDEALATETSLDPGLLEIVRHWYINQVASELRKRVVAGKNASVAKSKALEEEIARLISIGDNSPASRDAIERQREVLQQEQVREKRFKRLEQRLAEFVTNLKSIGCFDEHDVTDITTYRKRQLRMAAVGLPTSLLIELWTARTDAELRLVKVRFEDMRRESLQRLRTSERADWKIADDYTAGRITGTEVAENAEALRANQARMRAFQMFDAYFKKSTLETIEESMPPIVDLFTESWEAKKIMDALPPDDEFTKRKDLKSEILEYDDSQPVTSEVGSSVAAKSNDENAARDLPKSMTRNDVVPSGDVVYIKRDDGFTETILEKCFDPELFELARGRRLGNVIVRFEETIASQKNALVNAEKVLRKAINELREEHGEQHPLLIEEQTKLDEITERVAVYYRLAARFNEMIVNLDSIGWYGVQVVSWRDRMFSYSGMDPTLQLQEAAVSLPTSLLFCLWSARSEADVARAKARFKELAEKEKASFMAIQLDYLAQTSDQSIGLSTEEKERVQEEYWYAGCRVMAFEVFDEYFDSATLASIDQPLPTVKALLVRSPKAKKLINQLSSHKDNPFKEEPSVPTVSR